MSTKKHKLYYTIFLGLCISLILLLEPPYRNYIPVVWGLFGFGLHVLLFAVNSMALSTKLINEHRHSLDRMMIAYRETMFNKSIDIFTLFRERKNIESISADIKTELNYCLSLFKMVIIAFVMFAVLGILTVVMTWK